MVFFLYVLEEEHSPGRCLHQFSHAEGVMTFLQEICYSLCNIGRVGQLGHHLRQGLTAVGT